MNRLYLLPKVIMLFFSIVIVTKNTTWYFLILYLLISMLVIAILVVLNLAIHAYYYDYLVKRGKNVSKENIYMLAHRYLKMVNHLMRLEVNVLNYERFDKNKNYLIIPNHQSNADATVLLETFKSPVSFVSKFSLTKVPVISNLMKQLDCLFLKKDEMREQIIIMNEVAEKLLIDGNKFIIFPEGKRSFSHNLNDFKSGTFKMATKTKVDILPITLNHVHKLRHNFPYRKTVVNVYFHEPISYDQYKDLGTKEIAEMVKGIIESKIEE